MDRRVLCARPTCGSAAQAALHYDYASSTAWLDPLGADPPIGAWPMCAAHAETLRVPSGWKLVDRRPPVRDRPRPAGPRGLTLRPPLAV